MNNSAPTNGAKYDERLINLPVAERARVIYYTCTYGLPDADKRRALVPDNVVEICKAAITEYSKKEELKETADLWVEFDRAVDRSGTDPKTVSAVLFAAYNRVKNGE